jgi:hypothetical protein
VTTRVRLTDLNNKGPRPQGHTGELQRRNARQRAQRPTSREHAESGSGEHAEAGTGMPARAGRVPSETARETKPHMRSGELTPNGYIQQNRGAWGGREVRLNPRPPRPLQDVPLLVISMRLWYAQKGSRVRKTGKKEKRGLGTSQKNPPARPRADTPSCPAARPSPARRAPTSRRPSPDLATSKPRPRDVQRRPSPDPAVSTMAPPAGPGQSLQTPRPSKLHGRPAICRECQPPRVSCVTGQNSPNLTVHPHGQHPKSR